MGFQRSRKTYQRMLVNLLLERYPKLYGELGSCGGTAVDIVLFAGRFYIRVEVKTSKKSNYTLQGREIEQLDHYTDLEKRGIRTWYAFYCLQPRKTQPGARINDPKKKGYDPEKFRFSLPDTIRRTPAGYPQLRVDQGMGFDDWCRSAVEPFLPVDES